MEPYAHLLCTVDNLKRAVNKLFRIHVRCILTESLHFQHPFTLFIFRSLVYNAGKFKLFNYLLKLKSAKQIWTYNCVNISLNVVLIFIHFNNIILLYAMQCKIKLESYFWRCDRPVRSFQILPWIPQTGNRRRCLPQKASWPRADAMTSRSHDTWNKHHIYRVLARRSRAEASPRPGSVIFGNCVACS